MTLYDYIKKYGNMTFKEKSFNEIDNMIFSLIVYLDFSDLLDGESCTIEYVANRFFEKNNISLVSASGTAFKDACKCLELIKNTNRYKDVKIKNYIYIGTDLEQFSALTFKISRRLMYVAFEGTDNLISGWKENFQLSYMYPTLSQVHAIRYLSKMIKIFGPKVIVGGHSKGGNLAQVASMEVNFFKKLKIMKIYNNDGPGLRKKEFISKKYRCIRKKLVHIIPYNSVAGILLRNDQYKVVASTKKTILSHYMSTWMVYDDQLIETDLSEKSLCLEKSIIEWLNNHDDNDRKNMIDNVFNVFRRCDITDLRDLKKVKAIFRIIREVKNIDDETKSLVSSFINYNFF